MLEELVTVTDEGAVKLLDAVEGKVAQREVATGEASKPASTIFLRVLLVFEYFFIGV
jgi:hypothetical protein